MSDDDISFVEAEYVKQWCSHTGQDFLGFVLRTIGDGFSKMVVCDYLFGNTDRHINNWGFLVDVNTNELLGVAPLFDHNQALVAFGMGTDVDGLVYEPTGKTMFESAKKYYGMSGLEISGLPGFFRKRLDRLRGSGEMKYV